MSIADTLVTLATRILPPHRRDWGEAMMCEVRGLPAGHHATTFARGCLWAAITERVTSMNSVVSAGRWGVGLVTAAYGAFHMLGFASFITALLGKPSPYYILLIKHGQTAEAAGYLAAIPYLALYMLGMGTLNLAAAFFLIRWNPRLFSASCLGVALTAAVFTAYALTDTAQLGRGTIWGWQAVPLVMLVMAAFLLSLWEQKRPTAPALPA